MYKKDLTPYRDELLISTKAGYYMWEGPYGEWGSRKNLLSSLDRSLTRMGNRWIEDGLQEVLDDNGVGSIAYCPLGRGQLTNKYVDKIEAESKASSSTMKPEAITAERVQKFRSLEALAARRGETLSQMALSWVLREGGVTSALIGVSSVSQIEENVKALESAPLSAEELTETDDILHQIGDLPW